MVVNVHIMNKKWFYGNMIKIIERWKGYCGKLLNEANPRTVFGDGVPNEGITPAINRKEVEVALKGMKHEKAMGPDGIPVEVWKSLGG